MRKVTFHIDDAQYFKGQFKKENPNLTDEEINSILCGQNPFRVIYSLFGDEKTIDHYELTDYDGKKININNLNGFQRGVILSDCIAYFMGGNFHYNKDHPCGVVHIEESVL